MSRSEISAARITSNEALLKRIGMFKEDTDFNRRAAEYAETTMMQARAPPLARTS
jgi:hypothetical protein